MSEPIRWTRIWLRAGAATAFGLLYTSLFWIQPLRKTTPWKEWYRFVDRSLYDVLGFGGAWRWAVKSYLMVGLAILLLWALGKKPKALGMGRMAQQGWRIIALAMALAFPVEVWLGMRPTIHRYYASMFSASGWEPVLANALVIAVEHALIEGVILALALPPGWSFEELGDDPPRRGRLAWLGFGLPEGERGFFAWIGVPAVVFPALIGQAVVFGVVHSGKEVAEFWTAWPGGLGLGLLTYRIRSVWPSVLLHLGTGAVILTTAWLTR